ncbi:MAG: hypothetical protein JXA99_04235 [Candidatus Lokiarchaeota archaeon]|nr:hypothetical protein [Candidatus Lokiarchaeota archaeon]
MVKGVALITWDTIEGGVVQIKYPDNLNVPNNIVQQIQISHNFSESYIITEEKNWNSISFFNKEKEAIIMLILEKYDDGSDYIPVLEEFNKEIETNANGGVLKEHLKRIYDFSLNVFRTRDEVISKLSNEVAQLRTKEYDVQKKIEKIINSDYLPVKSKIQILLSINDYQTFDDLLASINTSKNWLQKVLNNLVNKDIIEYNKKKKFYHLQF